MLLYGRIFIEKGLEYQFFFSFKVAIFSFQTEKYFKHMKRYGKQPYVYHPYLTAVSIFPQLLPMTLKKTQSHHFPHSSPFSFPLRRHLCVTLGSVIAVPASVLHQVLVSQKQHSNVHSEFTSVEVYCMQSPANYFFLIMYTFFRLTSFAWVQCRPTTCILTAT